jgi:CheY-like chemotaxis protein/tetratricopeptide (TPR) repeat protein
LKRFTGSWKVITPMRECPVCKSRYDTGVEVCPREGAKLSEILVTTYPNPESGDQQVMLNELLQALKTAAISNDLKRLREGYVQLANYHHKQGQLNQALTYYHKAELLETGDAVTTQLPAITEIYLQQSRTGKAIELVRRVALLYGRAGLRDQASEYFKRLITMRSSDLKWVREILSIIEESGLTFDADSSLSTAEETDEDDFNEVEYVVTASLEDDSLHSALTQINISDNGSDGADLIEDPVTATILPRVTFNGNSPNPIPLNRQAEPEAAGGPATNGTHSGNGSLLESAAGSGEMRTGRSSASSSGSHRAAGELSRSSGSYRASQDTSKFSFSDQTAMIVDDDEGVRDLLAEMLIEIGCHVSTAVDGEDAIEKLEQIHPSFIISDVIMPRKDGYELFQYVQSNERFSDIPFIFLTGRGEIDEKLRALEGGVEDYWLKPFEVEELNIRLRRVLQKVRLAGDVRGRLSEMPLPDLLQSLASGNKSGVLHLQRSGRSGIIYIDQGRIIDAEFEDLTGKTAIYCLVNWCLEGGNFNFHSQMVDRKLVIKQSIQGILMEAMRRRDEETRLIEQLPPGDVFMSVNIEDNPEFFSADFSDETTRIIQLFDGTHSLKECLRCLQGDLETIQTVVALNKAGLLRIVDFGIQ